MELYVTIVIAVVTAEILVSLIMSFVVARVSVRANKKRINSLKAARDDMIKQATPAAEYDSFEA